MASAGSGRVSPSAAARPTPAINTTITAVAGAKRRTTRNNANRGVMSHGAVGKASSGKITKRKRTPASMPAATLVGICSITRSSGVTSDANRMSTAATINAPTASGMSSPAAEAVINAAPGVDHAVMIGSRWRTLRIAVEVLIAKQTAVIHDAVSAGDACRLSAAASTMAMDPPQPTIAAVIAATRGARDI